MAALTPADLKRFRQLLAERRATLADEVSAKLHEARDERIAPDTAASTDGGDRAFLDEASSVDLAEAARDTDELRDIDAALQRLDQGTFGLCTDCGADIGIARLMAYLSAARCSNCQQAHETRQRGPTRR